MQKDTGIPKSSKPPATEIAPLEAFLSDVGIAINNYESDDTPFNRRTLIRTIYAAADAWTNWLKQVALDFGKSGARNLSPSELSILRDETYYLDPNGTIRVQPKFSATAASFRFAANLCFGHSTTLEFVADWNDRKWHDFKVGLAARDRLMHPRNKDDLIVKDHEIKAAINGHVFMRTIVIEHLIKALEQEDRLKKALGIGA